jgi:hypothetical protein
LDIPKKNLGMSGYPYNPTSGSANRKQESPRSGRSISRQNSKESMKGFTEKQLIEPDSGLINLKGGRGIFDQDQSPCVENYVNKPTFQTGNSSGYHFVFSKENTFNSESSAS